MKLTAAITERFWRYVDKTSHPGGCWVWTGHLNSGGYGALGISHRPTRAHRISWALHRGAIPEGLCVLHGCEHLHEGINYRRCVNPAHLRLGTYKDNARDAVVRGRSARGERNGQHRLGDDDVRAIRMLRNGERLPIRALAAFFGCCESTISVVANRRSRR